MKKVIGNIILIIYVIIAVFVTVCLLSYNDYKITEFGDYSLVIVDDNSLNPEYDKGDLVITNKQDEVTVGEKVFFYNTYERKICVSLGKVTDEEFVTLKESTYTLDGDYKLSSEYVLGPSSTSIKIAGLGTVLGILESKWGFLFLIVFPSLLAFIYEIGVVVSEIKNNDKKEENKENE